MKRERESRIPYEMVPGPTETLEVRHSTAKFNQPAQKQDQLLMPLGLLYTSSFHVPSHLGSLVSSEVFGCNILKKRYFMKLRGPVIRLKRWGSQMIPET